MLNVKILSSQVEERNVTSKDGKSYNFRYQFAAVYLYNRDGKKQEHSRECKIPLDDSQAPYAPGDYTLSPVCLYLDKYQNLTISRVKLVAANAFTKAA